MFELGNKFGVKSPFSAEKQHVRASYDGYYPSSSYFSIETGKGWKRSPWERVYKLLRDRSKTYRNLVTPYENNKKVTYTFQSTSGREISTEEHDHTIKAVASTYINLAKYRKFDDHHTFIDRLAYEYRVNSKFHLKLHITSDFFDNERNSKLNDLGRALAIIHEGVHADIHYDMPYPHVIADLNGQHEYMARNYMTDLKKALKEFDSRLTEKEIFTLSISGLTAKKANGDALIIEFARLVLGIDVSPEDEDRISSVFQDEYLPMFRGLTESPYEIEK